MGVKSKAKPKWLVHLRGLDLLSKIAFVILVSTLTYVLLIFLLKPVFIAQDSAVAHTSMMGDHMMSFQNSEQSNLNIAAILGAVLAGTATALALGKKEVAQVQQEPTDELSIIKRVLSPDEKKLITVVEEVGEITQDSLTFRLEWSRAKISVIVTNLERLNILQRKREGKTYVIFLPKKNT